MQVKDYLYKVQDFFRIEEKVEYLSIEKGENKIRELSGKCGLCFFNTYMEVCDPKTSLLFVKPYYMDYLIIGKSKEEPEIELTFKHSAGFGFGIYMKIEFGGEYGGNDVAYPEYAKTNRIFDFIKKPYASSWESQAKRYFPLFNKEYPMSLTTMYNSHQTRVTMGDHRLYPFYIDIAKRIGLTESSESVIFHKRIGF